MPTESHVPQVGNEKLPLDTRTMTQSDNKALAVPMMSVQTPRSSARREKTPFLQHLRSPIRISYLVELELCLLTFCTGIQDATTFPDYHCFASNQTGNTVMLALAVTVPTLEGSLFFTANIGVSLALFLLGGWVTGQISHHFVNARSRGWLVFSNLVQTLLVFGAAGVQFKYGVPTQGPYALAVLVLLAFASGSQVVQSRSLAMTEISTAMATAAWVDL